MRGNMRDCIDNIVENTPNKRKPTAKKRLQQKIECHIIYFYIVVTSYTELMLGVYKQTSIINCYFTFCWRLLTIFSKLTSPSK